MAVQYWKQPCGNAVTLGGTAATTSEDSHPKTDESRVVTFSILSMSAKEIINSLRWKRVPKGKQLVPWGMYLTAISW